MPERTRPQRRCRRHRRAAGSGTGLAPGIAGATGAPYVLSLTWPASAVSHLPMAMDVQSGLLAAVSDQTRPQRRCRCHRRAAGGRSWAGTDHGWYSRRVVILEGLVPWHWPSPVRVSAGLPPVWQISSVTRPRRSRGYRTERGPTAGRHHCGRRLGGAGSHLVRAYPGPGAALGGPGSNPLPSSGQWPAHVRQEERERARRGPAPPDTSRRTRTRAPGGASHSAMTQVTGRVLARVVLCPSDASRTTGLALSR